MSMKSGSRKIPKNAMILRLREVFRGMLGYEKNEKLEFNYKKSGGLWLIAVAIVIAFATLIGGQQIINMQVFSIGYVVCFFSINVNKKLLKKLSTG